MFTISTMQNILLDIRYCINAYLLKKYKYIGYEYINKPLSDEEYSILCRNLYGKRYLEEKYLDNFADHMRIKYWLADLVLSVLPDIKVVCDAGANRGYLMKAFTDRGIASYGFDILEDKSLVLQEVRENFKLGSILDVPRFNTEFDLVISIDVFEHIPINKTDLMVDELKKLNPRYFVLQISKDMLNDGHITLKGTDFWVRKFIPQYRVMTELYDKLINFKTLEGETYSNTGIPKNDYNKCPGIIFLEKR